jgi:hypothetical protein
MCLQACYTGIFGHLRLALLICSCATCHLLPTVTTQPPTTRASSAADYTGSNTNTSWGWLSYHSRTIDLVNQNFGSRTAALHASFTTVVAESVEGLRFSRSLGWFVQGSKHHA